MVRRELLGVLGATAAGLAVAAGGEAHAQEDKRGHGDKHEQCAKDCFDCARECEEGYRHCDRQVDAGKKSHAKAEDLCLDCADVCVAAGKLVARHSSLMASQCRACAECCEACAAECEKLNDAEMKELIESCRKCAKACREMVQAMGGR